MSKNQVATIAPARLPAPRGLEDSFGMDENAWKVLTEAVFPGAQTAEAVIMALSYCKHRNLDIMRRPVHIVKIYNSELKKEVESVWPSIDLHRTIAHRTRDYAGTDETKFGPMVENTYKGKTRKGDPIGPITVRHPEWAQITVYKFVHGQRVPFPGPRCYFDEFYGERFGARVPNARWERAPVQMLEKVAEAAALRKAFPEEIGGEMTAEEMEGHDYEPHTVHVDAPPQPERPAEIVVSAEEQRAAEEEADRMVREQQMRDSGLWVKEVENEPEAPRVIDEAAEARKNAESWMQKAFVAVNQINDQEALNAFTAKHHATLERLKNEHGDLWKTLDLALTAAGARIATAS